MTAVAIAPVDLAPFAEIAEAKAQAMIADALGMAAVVAPCIAESEFSHADAAKAVIRGAILRWHEAGQGGIQQLTSGAFSQTMDTRQTRRAMFWPSEIAQLQKMCAADSPGAWSYDMMQPRSSHLAECALSSGGQYCSCGALLL
ncbi:hypothetical protein SBE55_18310 [Mycolicibacterium sp. 141076]|uniref:hypothetical protein n=1 Tax=Mycolicibacterium sp. 141076 TaxID=3090599 RepID=UPI00299DFCD0|nr:hypothetical protein [Mycolicibacterium sp. 141076]MDX1879765.1 hypothetical protein [Mycolicibacterium sp. 141076]